jgi:hypothetical protein
VLRRIIAVVYKSNDYFNNPNMLARKVQPTFRHKTETSRNAVETRYRIIDRTLHNSSKNSNPATCARFGILTPRLDFNSLPGPMQWHISSRDIRTFLSTQPATLSPDRSNPAQPTYHVPKTFCHFPLEPRGIHLVISTNIS